MCYVYIKAYQKIIAVLDTILSWWCDKKTLNDNKREHGRRKVSIIPIYPTHLPTEFTLLTTIFSTSISGW